MSNMNTFFKRQLLENIVSMKEYEILCHSWTAHLRDIYDKILTYYCSENEDSNQVTDDCK